MGWGRDVKVETLLGKTLVKIEQPYGEEELHFYDSEGNHYKMHHSQDCCENVQIEDIAGDLDDLIGSPLTMAEVVSNSDPVPNVKWQPESHTWTFYKFATIKGYVTIRWLGESNGYYSESVDFELVK